LELLVLWSLKKPGPRAGALRLMLFVLSNTDDQ